MNVTRGGALTALTLIISVGCGGSDAASVPGTNGEGGPDDVAVLGPEGGVAEPPSPPAPPPPAVGEPVKGVFVSASKGIEGADASMLRPVKTLAAAMAIAAQKKTLPVIACAETYNETVKLTDGVTMYGYFDCSGPEWKRGSTHAKIVSATTPAVLAENLSLEMRLEGFDISAPDMSGAAPSGTAALSSYGMVVKLSKHLRIADVHIFAGKGQDGTDGLEPASGNVERSARPTGNSGSRQEVCNSDQASCLQLSPNYIDGASGGTSSCKVGPNGGPGGWGGDGPVIANKAYKKLLSPSETSGGPIGATAVTAAGGAATGNLGSNTGSDGAPGAAGTMGITGTWSFTAAGFVPGDGTSGANGTPGQGGGGGPGTNVCWGWYDKPFASPAETGGVLWGPTGAGGGAGGCGGLAGTAGTGGGASVAMLVVGSDDIRIEAARLEPKKGGRGGKGTLGTVGTPGNAGGLGEFKGTTPTDQRPSGLYGGAGGRGGDGGSAGLGGHGAPGPSIALVFTGKRPTTTSVDLLPGTGGDGAAALARGGQSLPATVGIAKQEHSF